MGAGNKGPNSRWVVRQGKLDPLQKVKFCSCIPGANRTF